MTLRKGALAAIFVLSVSSAVNAAPTVAPTYATNYALNVIGTPGGIPGPLGGVTFLDNDTLLIGGAANGASGAIYAIDITRDANQHITGFSGTSTFYASAPNIDGGLAFGPGGVLFYTAFPSNALGQIKPGSTSPDKIISLSSLAPQAISSSVGTLVFSPGDFTNPGFKILSYNGWTWYNVGLTPDAGGTFDITSVSAPISVTGGPEGAIYVRNGNPLFSTNSVLISEYSAGKVGAYPLDASGNPILAQRTDFITGLSGAEGAIVDPVTGDFIFSTFNSGNQVVVVQGFTNQVPEPASLSLLAIGAAALLVRRRR